MRNISVFLILAVLLHGASLTGRAKASHNQIDMNGDALEISFLANPSGVSVGHWHACAIRVDGKVFCWGANEAAQLGNGAWNESLIPTQVMGLGAVEKIVSGERHTCVLTVSGGVKCWGFNEFGQLGDGATYWASPTPKDVVGLASGVASLSAGRWHTCAITNAGGVKCWGWNQEGQLGDGTTTNSSVPVDVAGLSSGAFAVAAGWEHTCALINGGAVKCWGRNWAGQLGDGTFNDNLTPVSVLGLFSGVTVLATGDSHTCASQGTGVQCWGRNWDGQLGDGTYEFRSSPVDVLDLSDPIQYISAGADFSCAVNTSGGVKCWGRNSEGQLGDGTRVDRITPVPNTHLASGVMGISSMDQNSCAVLTGGSIKCWGMNDSGQAGDNTVSRSPTAGSAVNFSDSATYLSAGFANSCLLANEERAYCWGLNNFGQIGDSSKINKTNPTLVPSLTGIRVIKNGGVHSCILDSQGGVMCWGYGWAGQLGNGSWDLSLTPVNVNGLSSGVIQISAGWFHNCVVTNSDGVKCWGRNDEGQLGDGTTDWSATPVDVIGLDSGVAMVESGYLHTCAVLSNGRIKCWGKNRFGALGDGTTNSSLIPVDVVGITNAVAVSLGFEHTCALTSTGGVKCWGLNNSGMLGDGTYTNTSTPVDVIGLTSGVSKIANGEYHSCALLSGGGARCWGKNISGQLGNNTVYSSGVPVDVSGFSSGGQAIDAGIDHTCVLFSDGTIKCWGSNAYGQLGLGDIPWKITPVGALIYSVRLPLVTQ